ncbi:hypothetical protein CFOL_v3_25327 [Cephalotus follicularis]|uniref:Uncharacterized protein n=1 Tax=Cephalotus follicularis TaxID=3775 RepID=A0A1Q3CNN2_CEPFO|nr:hypothetical protein CFOL_v3_25327 [Cephalotus follicularis]
MEHKASSTSNKFPEKMTSAAPIAIGTRGTIGSLVRKEIEYFTKFELDPGRSFRKPQGHIVDMASRGPSLWFLMTSWTRKKRKRKSGFFPSICSVVEVVDRKRMKGISGFNYKILKENVKNMPM